MFDLLGRDYDSWKLDNPYDDDDDYDDWDV